MPHGVRKVRRRVAHPARSVLRARKPAPSAHCSQAHTHMREGVHTTHVGGDMQATRSLLTKPVPSAHRGQCRRSTSE
eukprot:3872694-Pyramimonas_sp.AAC.2